MSGSTDQPPLRRNPFSPMAVAKITGFDESDAADLTIETDAIRQATSYLSAYLRAAPPGAGQDRAGEVIAILGDYGTGKTHLAVRLMRHARRVLDDPARTMYLDATADGFIELYRRFMRKLGLAGVRNRVSDYYADIVAEALQSSGLDSDVVEWLRNRELVPQEVVDKLGLMESALLRRVQQTLQRITDNSDFGAALTLLLRSGFDEVVWAWLTGGKPDKVLLERGITKPIDSDAAALEAMGVFALLYGGPQARFVLVIDELDKIFSGANQPEEDIVTAFQKLLEVFANAGACLVLSGLPEFRRVLSPSAVQRVSRSIEMAGLSTTEVCSFIKLAQKVRFDRDQLAPFTRESVQYLRDITGGKARSVIRLCHDVYSIVDEEIHATGDAGVRVTDAMVRQAARRQFGSLSADDIDGVVRRVLDANGWSYLHNHILGAGKDSMVDFWVTFHDRAGGCAVLLTESVLDDADANAVAHRCFAIRESAPGSKVILVINGVLANVFAAKLAEPLDAEPLVYVERGFTENFRALVGAISAQLSKVVDSNPLAMVQQRIEQINRQQSSIYGFIEQLVEHIDEGRHSADRRLAAIQRELNALTPAARSAEQPTQAKRSATTPSILPTEVDKLFLDAVDTLEELTQLGAMMDEAFGRSSTETSQTVQRRLGSANFFEAVGVALLMHEAVLAFRTAVIEWYTTEAAGSSNEFSDAAGERLDVLCHTYDDVTEFLPIFKLDPLIQIAPWTTRSGAGVTDVSQSNRRSRVRAVLDNLSPRVRRALPRYLQASGS